MSRRSTAAVALAVLLLSACTTDGDGRGDATAGAEIDLSVRDEADLPTVEAAPVAATPPDDAEVVGLDEVEPVPLADLGSWVDAGVDEGLFTEAEGLASALRYLTGDTEATDLPGVTEVATPGGTGLVRRAADLLEAGEVDGVVADELTRLVRVFSPAPGDLDAVSVPREEAEAEGASGPMALAMGAGGGAPGANTSALADGPLTIDLSCNDLAAVGFAEAGGLDDACLVYDEKTVNGHAQRVYYPKAWLSDDSRDQARTVAMEALVDSATRFGELGRHEAVSLVFSLTPSPEDDEAVQAYFDDGDACPITVFRAAFSDGIDQFKQVLAHEAFHCFQDWNFTAKPYEPHRWWLEGSAEYFSNVVYPGTDHEHGWITDFDQKSLTTPLWEMSYATTVFFQHLANNVGDPTVIATLEELGAAGGGSSSAGVLEGVGDMQTIFNELVVSWMSDGIADTGGSRLQPGTPTTRKRTINAEQDYDFQTQPFVATRWSLDYQQKHRFEQAYDDDGALHGFVEAEQRTNRDAWTLLPEEVRSTCKEDDRNFLVTTTVDEDRTFTIEVSTKERGVCDPCLLGAWDMHLSDFEAMMRQVMASAPGVPAAAGDVTVEIPGGNYYLGFDDDNALVSQRSGLQIRVGAAQGAVTFIIDGRGSGTYETDGEVLTVSDLVEQASRVRGEFPGGFTVDQTPEATTFNFFGNTGTAPVGSGGPSQPEGESASYTCDEDLLTIELPLATIDFDRIEEIPEPEALEDTDPS